MSVPSEKQAAAAAAVIVRTEEDFENLLRSKVYNEKYKCFYSSRTG
jgi:hypothetical protein